MRLTPREAMKRSKKEKQKREAKKRSKKEKQRNGRKILGTCYATEGPRP
jgi:hypothetical protein